MTTRTFILNSAVLDSEKLRSFNLKAKSSVLELDEYDVETKRQLLYNHIFESLIREELKDVLIENSHFIISHENFSPRSVEFITTPDKVNNYSPQEFERYIYNNFNKPDEIWRHAYEQQINDVDRFLLNTLISFGNSAILNELRNAFNRRLEYEISTNGFQRPLGAFMSSLKRLEGGFIKKEIDGDDFTFINHSLTDFLIAYLNDNEDEVMRIVDSAFYLKQIFTRAYPIYNTTNTLTISKSLTRKLLNDYSDFIIKGSESEDSLNLIFFIDTYLGSIDSERIILSVYKKLSVGICLMVIMRQQIFFSLFCEMLNVKE